MTIAFIWAQDANGLIGQDGHLPWHLSDDLKYFKQRTLGQIVLMGRKTFEGMGSRPLPRRDNLVLTRQADYQVSGDNIAVVTSPEAALEYAEARPDQTLFVIGGAGVFMSFADKVDTLYVTRIAGTFTGDTVMPELDFSKFKRTGLRTVENDDPQLTHSFETWERL
ncbi:dihydrofolate reductase [Lacticaseibacillus zhaodongensis]|uniref:dihydrofolate reductase n=1 Tax=Lacticaseibacillus zhaodongensis TaxID=2668065 RepID=UPI0012D35685|nr:dihydrofolate reductase [Lacticaseibacillus zhaodongensis]